MNASDVMVSAVITVKPDATVQEAAQLMLANRVSGLSVVDFGKPCRPYQRR